MRQERIDASQLELDRKSGINQTCYQGRKRWS